MAPQRKIKAWERGDENALKARTLRLKKKDEERAKDEELSRLRVQVRELLQKNGTFLF